MGSVLEESTLKPPPPPSPIPEDPLPSSRFCCFHFPCFRSHRNPSFSPSFWERVGSAHYHQDKWWIRVLVPLKKLREWSELMAGPRWKTFIRRFNRYNGNNVCCGVGGGGGGGGGYANRHGKFHYDPLSYSLNFDEGHGQNGDFYEDDAHGLGGYRNFSARFAAVPGHSRAGSVDLLKGKEVSVVG